MGLIQRYLMLVRITGADKIARRYLVVNGFDGALAMLGILTGFIVSDPEQIVVVTNACIGAAVALGVSGVSSAYVSESAERRRELGRLQAAMVDRLDKSYHAIAARRVPVIVALVNGLAPLGIALVIIAPLWLARLSVPLPGEPVHLAVATAFVAVFLLGVYLGRIENVSWLASGVRTLVIALVTAALIVLLT